VAAFIDSFIRYRAAWAIIFRELMAGDPAHPRNLDAIVPPEVDFFSDVQTAEADEIECACGGGALGSVLSR
jgi:hypothetical protein